MSAILRMRDVHKRFGGVAALSGVDLEVSSGEVHALVGENGAGKSTLMKVLSGVMAADHGSIELSGAEFAPRDPGAARRAGVAMIYQELNLALDLTVAENIVLGREPSRHGMLDRRRRAQVVAEAMRRLGGEPLDPEANVRDLRPAQRQLVEILRALSIEARVVVMDEPTSSLSSLDAARLFHAVKRMADDGIAVIYISHFLEEVMQIADRYTVLRDGRTVTTAEIATTRIETILEQMVGRPVDEVYPRVPREKGECILRVERLAGPLARAGTASFALHRGEIFGIAGLMGAGRTELLRAIFGLDPIRQGTVTIAALTDRGAAPWTRWDQGVGLLSEDRRHEGLALRRSVAENLTLSSMRGFRRAGWLNFRKRRAIASEWAKRLRIKHRDVDQPVGQLSGGNQQKVALGRLLHHDVDILLLDEPTRGVDIGSKAEIYQLIGELAQRGKAILFVSSYTPELLGVCDRIAVMHSGELGPDRPATSWSEHTLLEEATRGAA